MAPFFVVSQAAATTEFVYEIGRASDDPTRQLDIHWVLWIASGPRIGAVWADDLETNTYTTGNQLLPSVALDADGDSVVVW